MFDFFKKTQIHEPLELQRKDVLQYPMVSNQILSGIDCDKVPNGKGEFGSLTNPIPVNSSTGEIKYLSKLRGKSGSALLFHRLGSLTSPVCSNPVDCYEIVCKDGSERQWNKLYFDPYHPRRSNLAPKNYTLMPYMKDLKMDLPYGFGTNGIVVDFPFGLPDAVIKMYGEHPGITFARHIQESLNSFDFTRDIKYNLVSEWVRNANVVLIGVNENVVMEESVFCMSIIAAKIKGWKGGRDLFSYHDNNAILKRVEPGISITGADAINFGNKLMEFSIEDNNEITPFLADFLKLCNEGGFRLDFD